MNNINKLFCTAVTLVLFGTSVAQDTHYWNIQYGTRATLLGGAVIGSVSDLSATFYNPAAVALFPGSELLLTAKVYQYNSLGVTPNGGDGVALNFSAIEPAPSLLAGSFNIGKSKTHKLAYSILTRQHMNFGIEGRHVIDNSKDEADEIIAAQNFSDLWTGLTWSYHINNKIGFGVTQYLAIGNQKSRKTFSIQQLDRSDFSNANQVYQYEYKNYRLITKFGFGMSLNPLTFGLTVTTPSLQIYGTGSSYINISTTTHSSNANDIYFAADDKRDLTSTFHSPMAIGGGFSYLVGIVRLHTSAEWFDSVAQYDVLNGGEYIPQSDGIPVENRINNELKSVLNFGLGLDVSVHEKLALYGSFVTDYSAHVPNGATNLTISTWDIYHLSSGAAFSIGRSEFTAGINYAFGNDIYQQKNNKVTIHQIAVADNILDGAEISYRRLKFLLGFSIGF